MCSGISCSVSTEQCGYVRALSELHADHGWWWQSTLTLSIVVHSLYALDECLLACAYNAATGQFFPPLLAWAWGEASWYLSRHTRIF